MSSASGVGGVETWLSKITRALSGWGWEPVVALTRGLKSNDPAKYKALQKEVNCIEVNGAGLPQASRILACLRIIQKVKPSVVLSLGVIDAVPACGMAKQSDKQLRVLCRTQGLLPPMLADLEEFESVFDMSVCDGLLNAEYLKHEIGYPSDRVRHIPNGADLPVRLQEPREPGEPVRLVYLGRLTSGDKCSTDLVPFVSELDEIGVSYRLLVVGDGPARERLTRSLGPNKHVSFTGALPHGQVYENTLPFADILLSFSSSESFGIAIVEAMMHGVVPVSSRFLGHRSVGTVEDRVNALLFDIGDVRRAAQHVELLTKQPELLRSLSIAAKSKAHRDFGWEQCMSAWLHVLEEIHELPARPAKMDFGAYLISDVGRLNRVGMPTYAVDLIRRVRARFSPPVEAGGEEWPLYLRHHSAARLQEIAAATQRLERTWSEPS